MNLNYIAVVGYGWTGSSVVVDLLKEFDGYGGLDTEFSIIWEPNGILDLEKSLVDDWDFLRHDKAIKDFITYCQIQNRKGGKFSKWGANLSNKLDVDFMSESLIYVKNLTNFVYRCDSRILDYDLSAFELFAKRIKKKIGLSNTVQTQMYMARPSKEDFLLATKNYINKLFENFAQKNNFNNIILDQAIPASNIFKTMQYFDNIKSIVVDRDPRDVYVNLLKRKALIGAESSFGGEEYVHKYIKWHKILREGQHVNNDAILNIKFEDIILDYTNSSRKIINFLNITAKHLQKNTYFKPEVSKNKIGLWKAYDKQDEIALIYAELKDYCYEQ